MTPEDKRFHAWMRNLQRRIEKEWKKAGVEEKKGKKNP